LHVKNNKGAITVFISIVLSAVFLVIGTFTDAARISLAHSHVQRANKTALTSLLACYNNDLKDEYGLFGAYLNNDTMQENFEEYLLKNLNIYKDQNFLYDFRIEKTNIEQPFNLENRDIFERQIMEYMKYRAPYEIASDLIAKVDGIKNISIGSKVYKRKMETDKQADVIGKLQLSLSDKTKKIIGTGITSKITSLKVDFLSQNTKYSECTKKISELQEKCRGENNQDKKDGLLEAIKSVQEEINDIISTKDAIKSNIVNTVNSYRNLNSEAILDANIITTKKGDLLKRIKDELQYTNENPDGIQELQKSYKDDLSNMQKVVAEDNSADIIGSLESNVSKCEDIVNKANGDEGGFLSELDKISEASINYIFNKASPAQSDDEDNRDKAEQALKDAFNKKGESKTIDSRLLKQLPSRKEKGEEETETKNWDNMDFDDESYADSNLEDISSKESIIGQMASKITEQLYVNEYIMGTFKHGVPLLKDEDESKAFNLRSEDKTKRDAYFSNYEVEYIINGNKDEEINSLLIKSEILSIRLISNVIHIYTDPSKMSRITSLAAALSVWSAGLATPLIQTMLVFSWAMVESLYDVDQLIKGEKIPLFKTKTQWKTDITGAVDKKKDTNEKNNPLCLSYQDYLKIFLIIMNNDKKLARIQDLVQLNIGVSSPGFLLEDCKVMLKANTTVSMKNMFLSFPLFTAQARRNISRSYVSEDMCIGY
jgi:hypothetical protein